MSLELIGAACVETRGISLVQHSRGIFPEAKLTLYLSCILSEQAMAEQTHMPSLHLYLRCLILGFV